MIQIKNFLLILIVCFFSVIEANAAVDCSVLGMELTKECQEQSQTIGDGSNVKGQLNAPEAFAKNVQHQMEMGQIKVTQAQIRKISNPIEVLRQGAEKYTSKLRGYAEKLFFWLALLSFAWHFGFLALKRADMGEFFAKLTRRKLRPSFF